MLARSLAYMRRCRSFRKDTKGVAAVEFAMVAVPFLGLMGTIVETGLVFLSTQALEGAATVASRAIMVGQVSRTSGGAAAQEAKFKQILCDNVKWFIKCTDLLYDVRNYADYPSADLRSPVTGGNFDTTGLPRFNPGGANAIVVTRIYYKRKIWVDYLGAHMGYLNGGYNLIIGTAVFKTES